MIAAPPALAIPARPFQSQAFYVTGTNSSNWVNRGCDAAKFDVSNSVTERTDILAFGEQQADGTGSIPVTGPLSALSVADIKSVTEDYAEGYYGCATSKQTLWLGVGTNNSGQTTPTASLGASWANMIDNIAASSYGQAVASRVTFWGANDIESWNHAQPGDAENWAQGFNGATGRLYIDFGSANGCPEQSYVNSATGGPCQGGWTQRAYWYVVWGNPAAEGTPEIYYSPQADEWHEICLYGAKVQTGEIIFRGPITSDGAGTTLTADGAWNQFWNDLNPGACAQTPTFEIYQHPET